MKKTLILLTFICLAFATYAQKGKVSSALNFKETGRLDKALEAINEAIDSSNPKTKSSITWPRTWEVRGEIFQAVAQSKDDNMKKLAADPLSEALKSYKKALELDTKGRFTNSVKIKLTLLTNDLTNQAVESFNAENYDRALLSFEQILELQEIPIMKADNPGGIDTVIVFNAGLAAFNAGNLAKAIKFYGEAAKHGYNEGRTFQLLSKAHLENKDTVSALIALQQGFQKYPEDNGILVEMINIYINSGKTNDAMKYLSLAIEQDPENSTYYFAQGSLYDQLGEQEKAIQSYKKAISVNPEYYDAHYNLGALFYNNGVKQIEVANKVPANDNARYEAELKKADEWFEKALPLMEKCRELKPDDPHALESLRNLYYRLQMMDKYEEIIKLMGQ
jgi:tetratricopeptide (TPR) repeat protein